MSVSRSHFQISCFGVFGPLKSVRRPQDVIYFLKAMTNSFHTISKVYFAKCTRLTHLLCFASLFVIHWHVNMYIEQSPNLHSWLYNFFNSPEYFRLFFFGGGGLSKETDGCSLHGTWYEGKEWMAALRQDVLLHRTHRSLSTSSSSSTPPATSSSTPSKDWLY